MILGKGSISISVRYLTIGASLALSGSGQDKYFTDLNSVNYCRISHI